VLGATDCEQIGTGWLAQPVNAVSSLVFVPAGAWVAGRASRVGGRRRAELVAIGAALVANGIGSFAYHGPQPSWAKWAHDLPIVAVVGLLTLNEAFRAAGVDPDGARPDAVPQAGRVAVVAGAAALAAYVLGRTESPLCQPESPFQLHAAWHVLSAVALAAVVEVRVEQR
jgi:hypothetical protein